MLSGWSPSLFKVLQTKGVVEMTPADALRIQLEDKRYDLVRERCREFLEMPPLIPFDYAGYQIPEVY
jgi:nitrate reductase cytochrome c-type subunit